MESFQGEGEVCDPQAYSAAFQRKRPVGEMVSLPSWGAQRCCRGWWL